MKLIVGLGNPGSIYTHSRHNIGFNVIKAVVKSKKALFKKDSGTRSLSVKLKLKGEDVVLALPLTSMNLSGSAVKQLLKKYKVEPGDLLVACDDLDLEFGRIKIKPGGSSGGHRGLESIISSLGTKEFNRLRIGIDRPHPRQDAADYVLSVFNKEEKCQLKEVIEGAVACCLSWIIEGINKSMDIFNRRCKEEKI